MMLNRLTFLRFRLWDALLAPAGRRTRAGRGVEADYARLGRRLLAERKFDPADAILAQGLAAFPDCAGLLALYAEVATRGGRYPEAKRRWTLLRDARPDLPAAWRGVAAAARVLNDFDDMSSTIAGALSRFPDDAKIIAEAARIAERRGAYEEGLRHWRRLTGRAPFPVAAVFNYANCLIRAGRYEEAGKVINGSPWRFVDRRGFLNLRGRLAMAQKDWDAAAAVWRRFCAAYPKDSVGWENLGKALAARQVAAIDDGLEAAQRTLPVEIPRVEDEDVRKMLLGFESIGDDCEFGLVQRRYGAEPLGLLRWNYAPLERLTAAVAAGFEGMGDPAHTELWLAPTDEYFILDRRWSLGMHTFMFNNQVDRDDFFPKVCRRVAYLRDKLLADLQAGEKILIFKSKDIALDALHDLHARLRSLGDVRLLYVKPAGAEAAERALNGVAGDIAKLADGLYVGFIDRLGSIDGEWSIAFDDWIAICRKVQDAETARLLARDAAKGS